MTIPINPSFWQGRLRALFFVKEMGPAGGKAGFLGKGKNKYGVTSEFSLHEDGPGDGISFGTKRSPRPSPQTPAVLSMLPVQGAAEHN